MFETAELGHRISKAEYRERVPALREALLLAQSRLLEASFPVIVLFAGVDGAGKSETVNRLYGWLDPHWILTHAFDDPSEEERERPEYWRFWRTLPARGRIGLFLKAWTSRPVLERVYGGSAERFDQALDEILAFERMLTDDGALILKFWMHLDRKAQKRRLEKLERDPLQSWRVTRQDWKNWRRYDRFIEAAERLIARTSTGAAPWHIVEGRDPRYRSLRVGTLLQDALEKRLEGEWQRSLAGGVAPGSPVVASAGSATGEAAAEAGRPPAAGPEPLDDVSVLSRLDLTKALAKPDYRRQLRRLRARLHRLQREARERKVSTILVFEGWDAAGKGGAIRRIASAIDARSLQIIPTAAPSDEERAHHYLWRFWRHLPRAGRVTIYDRSWYGRVLVERVEGFANEAEWRRAYAEINLFEEQLVRHGIVLVKLWLHIDPEEQLRRFQERQQVAYKRWKLTEEDWRNREKWRAYEMAVSDMVQQTSTPAARWVLVEANDKRYARVRALRTVCRALERGLEAARQDGAGKRA